MVLNWIRYGYRLPFERKLEPFHHQPRPSDPALQDAEQRIYEKLLSLDVIEHTTDSTFVSRSRLEPKKDGDYRLVVDHRHLNSHLRREPCKYETLSDLQHLIRQDDYMLSCDLENGYYHVMVHPSHRVFLTTWLSGHLVRFKALPFGLSTAPRVFTKFMRPVVAHLRSRGIRMLQYLDDSLFLNRSIEGSYRDRRYVEDLLDKLGLRRKPGKGQWEPVQQLQHLGVIIDTHQGTFVVPPKKLETIKGAASSLLRYASSHRRWVSKRKLSNLAGTVISLTVAMPLARTVTRSIYDAMSSTPAWDCDVQLDKQALRDLKFLQMLSDQYCHKTIWPPSPTLTIHTDASDTGWGAALNSIIPAQGFFNADQLVQHITAKELMAVLHALQEYHQHLVQHKVIRLVTDNMSVKAVINKGVSASPRLMAIYRRILDLCAQYGLTLQAEYIPTLLNVIADHYSRLDPSFEWSLPRRVFIEAERMLGTRTIDLFSSPQSAVCPRYCSLVPGPRSLGDAFDQVWLGEKSWICPPISLLARVIDRLRIEGAEAVVVAPYWPAATWFPILREISDYSRVLTEQEMQDITWHTPTRPDVLRNRRWRTLFAHVPELRRVSRLC